MKNPSNKFWISDRELLGKALGHWTIVDMSSGDTDQLSNEFNIKKLEYFYIYERDKQKIWFHNLDSIYVVNRTGQIESTIPFVFTGEYIIPHSSNDVGAILEDGKYLLTHSMNQVEEYELPEGFELNPDQLILFNFTNGEVKTLFKPDKPMHCQYVNWFKNEKLIIFEGYTGIGERHIYSIRIDGTGLKKIVDNGTGVSIGSISP